MGDSSQFFMRLPSGGTQVAHTLSELGLKSGCQPGFLSYVVCSNESVMPLKKVKLMKGFGAK